MLASLFPSTQPLSQETKVSSTLPSVQVLARRRIPNGTSVSIGAVKRSGKKSKKKTRKGFNFSDMTLRDAADLSGAILRGGMKIATTLFNVEEKLFDVDVTAFTPVLGTPNIQCLSAIGQGTDYYQREGNSVKARNLILNLTAAPNATAVYNFLRIIVFRDLFNGGTTPTATNLLEQVATANIVNSPYEHFLGDRYQILMDERIRLVAAQQSFYAHYAIPINDHLLFNGVTATVGATYNGSVWCMVVTDQAANGPSVMYYSRLSFVDN